MKNVKRVSYWLGSGIGIIVILAAVSFLLAKKFVNREHMKEEILAFLSDRIDGDVEFENVDIRFFHWPHVYIKNGKISVPDKLEGSFETLVVYPKLLPLLEGKVEISTLRVNKPKIELYIKDEPEEGESTEGYALSFEDLKQHIVRSLGYLEADDRGLNAEIKNGVVVLKKDGTDVLSLSGLNASVLLPDDELIVKMSSNSSFWKKLTLNGSINVKDYSGKGELVVNGLEPHKIVEFSIPGKELVSDSIINLRTRYRTEGLRTLDVILDASVPRLTLVQHSENLKVGGENISAELHVDENRIELELNNADLTYPELNLSGRYEIDKKAEVEKLSLRGLNVNAESVRESALFVAGENDIVDIIFEVVRGGTVPEITLEASGSTFRDLWRQGNFVIEGNMVNGNIYIPVAEFDIVGAEGDAVISDGTLKGTNLSGKLGNSLGYDGALLIGTDGSEGPLNLEIMIDADAAEVPPILEQFVHDEIFLNEMRRIKNVNGKAKGKFVLGDRKESPDPEVYVSGFDITADYDRFPQPLSVEGGKFDYADQKIDVEGLKVTTGKLSSPGFSGSFKWKNEKSLHAVSKDTKADLSELFLWLSSIESLRPHLTIIESAGGSAYFSSVSFTGPLSDPAGWQINAEGNVSGVDINIDGLDHPISIPTAEIKSTSGELSVSKAAIASKDSSVNVEMVLNNYFTNFFELNMDFEGTLGPAAMDFLSKHVKLPEELVFPGPISISDSSLVFKKNGNGGAEPAVNEPAAQNHRPADEIDLNVNIRADALEWKDSEKVDSIEKEIKTERRNGWNSPLGGRVSVKSESFKFKGLNWDSLDAMISFLDNSIDIDINEANLCGISTPGLLNISPPSLSFEFRPFTRNDSLANVLECLLDKAGIISGDFDFNGKVSSQSEFGEVTNSLEGGVELTSSNGRVKKYGGVAKFFSYLNFGELFRGDSPDFDKEGFRYDNLVAKADIKDGRVKITEAAMDGPSLKIVCEGYIDLVLKKLDLQVLVIPVMAVDSVIDKIPLVGYVLGDKYVSIPVKVTGDISDPKIEELSPSALRFGLLGIIKQTLNIPVTLIKPLKNKDKSKGDTNENEKE
ncbi:MAG: AsmA-like C-terminal domain-containing protein [Deltaproteobacteria bacterium]